MQGNGRESKLKPQSILKWYINMPVPELSTFTGSNQEYYFSSYLIPNKQDASSKVW